MASNPLNPCQNQFIEGIIIIIIMSFIIFLKSPSLGVLTRTRMNKLEGGLHSTAANFTSPTHGGLLAIPYQHILCTCISDMISTKSIYAFAMYTVHLSGADFKQN